MIAIRGIVGLMLAAGCVGARAADTADREPAVRAAAGTYVSAGRENGADAAPAPAHANRILLHPITSFYINGLNGRYERRVSGGRLGLGLPFHLGRLAVADVGTTVTWGAGLGVDAFASSRPGGLRLGATFEWLGFRRCDILYVYDDPDPAFPVAATRSYDVYHQNLAVVSLVLGYRWEYPARRFLLDLGAGIGYSRFSGPNPEDGVFGGYQRRPPWESPLRYDGFLPVGNFAVGIPF